MEIKVTDTDTTNGNTPHKLLINQALLIIIPPIDPRIPDGVAVGRGTTHAHQTPTSKVIIKESAHSDAHILRTTGDVMRMGRDSTTPRDGNTSIRSPSLNYPVLIGRGTTVSPMRTRSQDIGSPKGPTGSMEVRNSQIFHTPMYGNLTDNMDPAPTFGKVIRQELSHDSSTDI